MDRGKRACKPQLIVEAEGIPLVVRTTPADVNDEVMLPSLLDAMPTVCVPRAGGGGSPGRDPQNVNAGRPLPGATGGQVLIQLSLLAG